LDYDGSRILDDSFYAIFNAHNEAVEYKLPNRRHGNNRIKILDTSKNFVSEEGNETNKANAKITAKGFSVILLKQPLQR
jgi:glycogen operon protein